MAYKPMIIWECKFLLKLAAIVAYTNCNDLFIGCEQLIVAPTRIKHLNVFSSYFALIHICNTCLTYTKTNIQFENTYYDV
jgi:hypothetical protein